ncbi:MAG TPA: isochorismate synthase [Virgibacillus sp.]|nr:isochorismate synthase [Virgibacillus sp.]
MTDLEMEYNFFADAIVRANKKQTRQLVSFTKRISAFDPVKRFVSFGKKRGDRVFWGSTDDDFYLVGFGSCIEVSQNDISFSELGSQVHHLMENACIHDPFKMPGTGLVALGGKTFDNTNRHKTLWTHFPHQSLRIPKWLMTKEKDTFYCTVNTYVTPDSRLEDVLKDLHSEEHELFSNDCSYGKEPFIQNIIEIQPEQWKETVQRAVDNIKSGRLKKIVLARELHVQLSNDANIASILEKFKESEEHSYIFAMEYDRDCFIGATPERLVRMDREKVLSTCLAGTIRRGETQEENDGLKEELMNDEKNREEHDLVVQMIQETLSRYCHDIHMPDVPSVYPLKHLQHLYTPVNAMVSRGYHITDLVEGLHPTPALGGVPRDRALAFIRENEQLERGWYGAPLGWFDSNRNGEFAVGIRSGLVQGNRASLFAGCGIVEESDPEMEYEETKIKFSPMLSVVGEWK